ncbi:hypothetical protein [Devosia sp. SL43]|uniref:hypothetical protein n=1 Tax=Devosia sp. SL43 TaxID=2806348 RepID=UPI001F1A8892|nr:hypothetical protein [Devosia sp. SL43]UJW85189.1 hypothetical protein IM737_17565 [Devosia sp. SL43]
MTKPRVLLAWEGGAGRGPIVTLKVVAEALGDACIYDAALCRMDHAAEIAPLCELAFPGAVLWHNETRRREAGNPKAATWGEFLGDLNFGDPQFLITQVGWWLTTIKARQSNLLVGDFSPVALLAARLAGIAAVAVGTGYSVPPADMDTFPVLIPEFATRIYDEATLVKTVNAALGHFGGLPLSRLPDIYAQALSMPRTIAALDPYVGLRSEMPLPPLNTALPRLEGGGDEIFIYFSTSERDDAELMAAILSLDVPVRIYMPGITVELASQLAAAGHVVERAAVAAEDIGRRSRLMLHAGQHGSLCLGLGLGLVQIAFPQHLEQLCHARAAEALGTVDIIEKNRLDSDGIRAAILRAYHDADRQQLARAVSDRLYPSLFGDIHALVRERILPLLA